MRILVDARIGLGSGIGRFAANTVPLVAELLPQYSFDLLIRREDAGRGEVMAGRSANLSLKVTDIAPFSLKEQVELPRLARPYPLTWFTNYFVPLAFRQPFVAHVHDVLHQEPMLFPAPPHKRWLSHRTFAHVCARAKAVCYPSRYSQREFERRYGAPRRSTVVSSGIDHDGWRPFDPDNPPAKAPRLLVVAAAKRHKNFATALAAFARARVPGHWQLTIITPDDKLRSSIDVAALSQGMGAQLLQGVSDNELRTIYGETAVLLMPSLYEGFGLPLAEGLQAGAQCISSTAPSLVEVGLGAQVTFVDGHDVEGWTEAIERECARFDAGTVDPAATRANMRHASSFTWERVANRLGRVLHEVARDL